MLAVLAAITFSGFVDTVYAYNANHRHETFFTGTGTSAKRANELSLNLAQVQWTGATSDAQPLGFTLALTAGDGDRVVHGDGSDHVYQASIAYRARPNLVLEAGIFPCHVGMEAFYSKDNWNYTRSWLGELSPYYVTGVKASYAINDRWSAQLHVLNGWQLIHDDNDAKTIGAQLAYAHGPLTASLNVLSGEESPRGVRSLADVVVLYRVTPALQLGASADAGSQNDARWSGAAIYARYALNPRHAIAIRAEEFRDPDNGISGFDQRLRETTLTYELRPREQLILKFETRYDRSTAPVFAPEERSQFLALASAVVTF